MYFRLAAVLALLGILSQVDVVSCHGYLYDPPARSSLWRHHINGAVINYNDNALFCGGFWVLWGVNNGKCGVCGDRWDVHPRQNEAGGKYAKGIIGRRYHTGSTIDVIVNLTTNHMGYFEFRLCVNNDVTKPSTQACFDRNLLKMANGESRYSVTQGTGLKHVQLKLPVGVTCQQCILQWKYNTGNFWGCDSSGCGSGHGRQEQYYNCADISII